MGRTLRRRRQKKTEDTLEGLDKDESVVNLKKFMAQGLWENHLNLKLRNFPETGRGVYSPKNIRNNQIIIKIPYELMITYTTFQEMIIQLISDDCRLKMHDLLALFLAVEKTKQHHSKWWGYIQSLPVESPPLFWVSLTQNELDSLPEDLKLLGEKALNNFTESWDRIKKSLKKQGNVVNFEEYLWGYIMVNTRSVYIDPEIVSQKCRPHNFLIDEPSMALCPFLDMFNHSDKAVTEASLLSYSEGNQVCCYYQLVSKNPTRNYQEIFISYGSHDNLKLITEYGFFIPGNDLDLIRFDHNDVIKQLDFNLDKFQYDFIRNHIFNSELFIFSHNGAFSYNLKAFLFVSHNRNLRDYSSVVFSESYDENFYTIMIEYREKLLKFKTKMYESHLKSFQKISSNSHIIDFLRYRISSIKKLSQYD